MTKNKELVRIFIDNRAFYAEVEECVSVDRKIHPSPVLLCPFFNPSKNIIEEVRGAFLAINTLALSYDDVVFLERLAYNKVVCSCSEGAWEGHVVEEKGSFIFVPEGNPTTRVFQQE